MRAASIPLPTRFRAPHPGAIAALLLFALFAGALLSLISASGGLKLSDLANPYIIALLRSSLLQAALSTVLSLGFGMLIALALARLRTPPQARALRALLLVMTVAPTIVVVLGVVSIYGGSGAVAEILSTLSLGWPSIYGLQGILVAHIAMNAPYAARVFLNALAQVPGEHHRIAAISNFSPLQVFRQCDWPAIRREIPGLAALVMLLCFTSFAVVLTLGGGPRNATLEVAIYEALRIEVDFARAALLSLAQIAIALSFIAVAGRAMSLSPVGDSGGRVVPRADANAKNLCVADAFVLGVVVLFLAPIAFAPLAGFAAVKSLFETDVLHATTTSFLVAAPAAIVSVGLAALIASASTARAETGDRKLAMSSFAPLIALAVPPFALVAGLYGPLRRFGDIATLGLVLVPLVNALTALPFAYRLIEPAMRLSRLRYGKLSAHLSLNGVDRLRIVDWPILRRPLIAAFAVAFALSMGDFGVAALFGGSDFRTLPLLLNERMGAYRLDEAQAVALLMMLIASILALATETFADAERR